MYSQHHMGPGGFQGAQAHWAGGGGAGAGNGFHSQPGGDNGFRSSSNGFPSHPTGHPQMIPAGPSSSPSGGFSQNVTGGSVAGGQVDQLVKSRSAQSGDFYAQRRAGGFHSPGFGARSGNGGGATTAGSTAGGFNWSDEALAPPPRRVFEKPEAAQGGASTGAKAGEFLSARGSAVWSGLLSLKKSIVGFFNGALDYFNMFPKDAKVVFFGLDFAGKTTLLRVLESERLQVPVPTGTPQHGSFKHNGRLISTIDMGGHETARRLWKDYVYGVDAVFFIVDAADRSRITEAREELHRLWQVEALEHVPFAILGNKVDKPTAFGPEEFIQELDLPFPHVSGNSKNAHGAPLYKYGYRTNASGDICAPVAVFMVSIINKMGYGDAFAYMSDMLKNAPKSD